MRAGTAGLIWPESHSHRQSRIHGHILDCDLWAGDQNAQEMPVESTYLDFLIIREIQMSLTRVVHFTRTCLKSHRKSVDSIRKRGRTRHII
jgi:hypothetical protein